MRYSRKGIVEQYSHHVFKFPLEVSFRVLEVGRASTWLGLSAAALLCEYDGSLVCTIGRSWTNFYSESAVLMGLGLALREEYALSEHWDLTLQLKVLGGAKYPEPYYHWDVPGYGSDPRSYINMNEPISIELTFGVAYRFAVEFK